MAVAQFRGKIGRLVAPDLLKGDNVGIEPRKGRPAMGGPGWRCSYGPLTGHSAQSRTVSGFRPKDEFAAVEFRDSTIDFGFHSEPDM